MSKPFLFDVPIATERSIESVADVVTTNFATKKELQQLIGGVDLSQITTDISNLKSNKVDKVEGSSLATSAQLTQIETNKTDIASLKTDKADKSQLTGLATESYVNSKVENLGDLKGSCLKSELEDKKAECKANDMYIVTDDDNHIYFYNGTDWTDTSAKAHVDLSNYYDKGTVDSRVGGKVDKVEGSSLITDALKTQITTNQTNITSLQSGKVDKVSGKDLVASTDIAQITTNKTNIESIQSDLSELATFLNTYA